MAHRAPVWNLCLIQSLVCGKSRTASLQPCMTIGGRFLIYKTKEPNVRANSHPPTSFICMSHTNHDLNVKFMDRHIHVDGLDSTIICCIFGFKRRTAAISLLLRRVHVSVLITHWGNDSYPFILVTPLQFWSFCTGLDTSPERVPVYTHMRRANKATSAAFVCRN